MGKISEFEEYLQEEEIQELIQKLRSPHVEDRIKARQDLVRIGDQAIAPLTTLLHESDHRLACEAVLILNAMTSLKSPRSLVTMLRDKEPLVRWDSTKALIKLERGGVLPLLEALVTNFRSIYLQDAARDILKKLYQDHLLTREEERVLTVLEGYYPRIELAHAAQAALEALKENQCLENGEEVPSAAYYF